VPVPERLGQSRRPWARRPRPVHTTKVIWNLWLHSPLAFWSASLRQDEVPENRNCQATASWRPVLLSHWDRKILVKFLHSRFARSIVCAPWDTGFLLQLTGQLDGYWSGRWCLFYTVRLQKWAHHTRSERLNLLSSFLILCPLQYSN
jgi:hypothetical protein